MARHSCHYGHGSRGSVVDEPLNAQGRPIIERLSQQAAGRCATGRSTSPLLSWAQGVYLTFSPDAPRLSGETLRCLCHGSCPLNWRRTTSIPRFCGRSPTTWTGCISHVDRLSAVRFPTATPRQARLRPTSAWPSSPPSPEASTKAVIAVGQDKPRSRAACITVAPTSFVHRPVGRLAQPHRHSGAGRYLRHLFGDEKIEAV